MKVPDLDSPLHLPYKGTVDLSPSQCAVFRKLPCNIFHLKFLNQTDFFLIFSKRDLAIVRLFGSIVGGAVISFLASCTVFIPTMLVT